MICKYYSNKIRFEASLIWKGDNGLSLLLFCPGQGQPAPPPPISAPSPISGPNLMQSGEKAALLETGHEIEFKYLYKND